MRTDHTHSPCPDPKSRYALPSSPSSFRNLFLRHYGGFRGFCQSHRDIGVAIIVVDCSRDRLVQFGWVPATGGGPKAAIVGRHPKTHVPVMGSNSLALRHFIIITEPPRSYAGPKGDISYHVLDLHTGTGFVDEIGTHLRGLRSEGPTFLRCDRYAIFMLVTGDPTDWPMSPSLAYSYLPERVYLDEVSSVPTALRLHREALPPRPIETRRTSVTRTTGAMAIGHDLLQRGESALGSLEICNYLDSDAFRIGPAALRSGVLLGRYSDRCATSQAMASPRVSRVHLLLLSIDGALYAIDTASSNGSVLLDDPGRQVSVVRLWPGLRLSLAGVAFVRWQPARTH